jgi:uncharacterized protein (DUF1501 family)
MTSFQGTYIDTQHTQLEKLVENTVNQRVPRAEQARQLSLLRKLNAQHREERARTGEIDARIECFELAARMQLEATDAFDVSQEPESVRRMYGDGVEARQLMIARRLAERGVRFVQAWVGSDWDHHQNLEANHRALAKQCDQAIGALLKDLKQRGMLNETLVIWGGEFGRTPMYQGKGGPGRDHHIKGFSMWMAGGGVQGVLSYGATDELGYNATENVVHVRDLHATMLHLMGIDHSQFSFPFQGLDMKLTGVEKARVIQDVFS